MRQIEWTKDNIEKLYDTTGIIIIKPFDKIAIHFNNMHEAIRYVNEDNGVMEQGKPNTNWAFNTHANCADAYQRATGKVDQDGYRGWLWYTSARLFWIKIDGLQRDAAKMQTTSVSIGKQILNVTKNKQFTSIDAAIDWVIERGYSKASRKIIERSIVKNLNGATKTSYNMQWKYVAF